MSWKTAAPLALAIFSVLPPAWATTGSGSVTGTILDAQQQPVANITVRVTDVVEPTRTYSAVSGADGAFTVSGVAPGSYLVAADTLNTSWLQRDDSPILDVAADGTQSASLVLTRMAELQAAGDRDRDVGGFFSAFRIVQLGLLTATLATAIIAVDQAKKNKTDTRKLQTKVDELRNIINNLTRPPASPLK